MQYKLLDCEKHFNGSMYQGLISIQLFTGVTDRARSRHMPQGPKLPQIDGPTPQYQSPEITQKHWFVSCIIRYKSTSTVLNFLYDLKQLVRIIIHLTAHANVKMIDLFKQWCQQSFV